MCTGNSNFNSQISTSQLPQERKSRLHIYTGCFCLKFPQLHSFFFTWPVNRTAATHSRLEASYCKFAGSIHIHSQSFHRRIRFFSSIFQIFSITWQNGISFFLNILNSDIKMGTCCQLSLLHYRGISLYIWRSFCLFP